MKNLSITRSILINSISIFAALTSIGASAETQNYYFDGGSMRTITLDARWVADVNSANGQQQARSAGDSGVSANLITLRSADAPVPKNAGGTTSPVYREGDSLAGRPMALPGGVLVKLNPEWSESQVRAWAGAKGLTIEQRLNIIGNWYVLQTAAGNASLELANALHRSGEVLSATPNWWKQTNTR